MKTIYLFIIILTLCMASSHAFSCGGGDGGGGGGTTDTSATVPFQFSGNTNNGSRNVTSQPLRGTANPNRVDKHFQSAINFMNNNKTNKPKKDPDIEALRALMELHILSRGGK
ncbi:MAG: hypothetical protein KAJ62_12345 [Desulfobacteraceae bacterium]|nr:hypothetical protein [Desulfobacteraceae bacterium]